MSVNYTNLPSNAIANTSGRQAFVNFFSSPLEIDSNTLDAMAGFFTSKGFDNNAAISLSSVLIAQSKKDNINPLTLIDTLKGFNTVELNSLIAEIINYNRYKTSFLGFGPLFSPNPEVSRNILP